MVLKSPCYYDVDNYAQYRAGPAQMQLLLTANLMQIIYRQGFVAFY
jgi:hypothetical protein